MKYLILLLIKIYQFFTPKRFRGICLFKESCSNFVYRVAKEQGFNAGVKAFIFRFHNCRPDYHVTEEKGKVILITVENEIIGNALISDKILLANGNIVNEDFLQRANIKSSVTEI